VKVWFGACATAAFDAPISTVVSGPYRFHMRAQGYMVYTNQPPCAAFRAPGGRRSSLP
jgi:CO/xanthine dehydrogenase Mo-binding subunit